MTSPDRASPGQEREWIVRAQRGDADSFRCLIDAYDRRLLYFVRRFLPDTDRALDVLQDVWLTLFRRLPGLKAPEAFRVWLYQIAHDRVVDVVRRDRREEKAHEALRAAYLPVADGEPGHEALFDQAEFVHHALRSLSDDHREVLLLRFLEGLSIEEIAAALRCSPGTIKSRLHYARQALRREVEKLVHE